jgi:hypothetical protein
MKINSLCLSPNSEGERVGVRGYLADIFSLSPLTFILSPGGERNIIETHFLSKP